MGGLSGESGGLVAGRRGLEESGGVWHRQVATHAETRAKWGWKDKLVFSRITPGREAERERKTDSFPS